MKTDPLVDSILDHILDQCFTVDISILRRMEARLNLIVFCFILMTHFQGHKRFFVNADAEPRIKHRQFISKARSDYIKVRLFSRLKTFDYPENCKDYGSFDIS